MMVKFKTIKPFVYEMMILLLVVGVLTVTMLLGDFIEIRMKYNILTIVLLAILTILFLALFSRVANLGVRALFDFIFQSAKVDHYEFLKELPYQASVFSEKWGPNHEQSYGMYYLVFCKKNGEILTFISPVYLELEVGEEYTMAIASSSHILLNVISSENLFTNK